MHQSVIDTLVDAMRLRIEKEVLVLEAKFNDKFNALTNLVSETVKSGSEIEGRVKALIPEPVVIPDFAAQIEVLKSTIPTVGLIVDEIDASLQKKLDELEAKFAAKMPVVPDVAEIVKSAVGAMTSAQPIVQTVEPVLPDVSALVAEAVDALELPSLADIQAKIDSAIADIPKPEPVVIPEPPVLPDIPALVAEAIGALSIPSMAEIQSKIDASVSSILQPEPVVIPEPPALPDVQKMIDDSFELRNFPTLQAVEAQIAEAIGAIPAPSAVELPDFNQIVSTAIAALPLATNGNDGADGKDAAEIEVAPAIREGKSYTRGTYAAHNGGLWRASRETDPIEKGDAASAGWHCLVKGIAEVRVMSLDDGVIAVKTILSDGKDTIEKVDVGGLYYKGVYKKETEYSKNSAVTWGGSLWTASKKTSAVPGTNSDWILTAKRGSDAKQQVSIQPK